MTAMKTFDNTRPLVAAMACGIGRAAYEYACDFVTDHYVLARPVPRYSAIAERKDGGKLRLRNFVVEADDGDVIGDEPIWFGGEVRGWVTSGGYAHGSKASVASPS